MAFRWEIRAVEVQDAIDNGTGAWEPFAYIPEEDQGTIFVKRFVEIESEEQLGKASEVGGGLGENW